LLMLFMFLNVPDVANAVHVCITKVQHRRPGPNGGSHALKLSN
jgi:hypothetical protein